MTTFLQSLNQEFQDLTFKLNKLTDLITAYGGEVPIADLSPSPNRMMSEQSESTVSLNEILSTQVIPTDTASSEKIIEITQTTNVVEIPIETSNVNIHVRTPQPQSSSVLTNFEYPQEGSWKDKIVYALRVGGKLATAKELSSFIQKFDSTNSASHVLSMVRQYTSNLGKSGFIGVDATQHANKYFLK